MVFLGWAQPTNPQIQGPNGELPLDRQFEREGRRLILNAPLSGADAGLQAPYVIRSVALGTDPLFDSAITETDLASELGTLKAALAPFGIPVTTADMAFSFERAGNAPDVFNAVDEVSLNIMPFFNNDATIANA